MKEIFFKENIFEILDYLEEGIQIIDQRGKIIYFNQAAQRLEGLSSDLVLGRDLLEIYPSLSSETSTLIRVLNAGNPIFDVEQTFINYKGNKMTTLNSSLPIKSAGKMIGAIEISRDRTRVRELSEKILHLQTELIEKQESKRKKRGRKLYSFDEIIGQNKDFETLKALAKKAANTDSPVLVHGETGTGKELFVQAIHQEGPRREKPFVAQNCAALPNTLLEGILFGTVKGAFTGAEDRQGLFELADGGTLFLDEINSMPMALQAKILRVLQDGTVRRVGGLDTKTVDVRVITAMNISPQEALEKRQIRRDLYYRLGVIHIEVLPLRKRRDDILVLAQYFLEKFHQKYQIKMKKIDAKAAHILYYYDWPGNVRELENVIESIVSLYPEIAIIETNHIPNQIAKEKTVRGEPVSLEAKMAEIEKTHIQEAYEKCGGNVSQTATYLKVPRQTLQYKLKKYEIQ